jgi:hypothetical protein
MIKELDCLRIECRGKTRYKIHIFLCLRCRKEIAIEPSKVKTHSGLCRSCGRLDKYDKMYSSGIKVCGKCKKEKSIINDFYFTPKGRPVHSCKSCNTDTSKKYLADNPERRTLYVKTRYAKIKHISLQQNRLYRASNPERTRDGVLRSHYGITLAQYNEMFEKQKGLCAICEQPETRTHKGKICNLSVDHDHKCCSGNKSCGNCVVGLLCSRCNTSIGLLNDSPEIIRKALCYVERTRFICPSTGSKL